MKSVIHVGNALDVLGSLPDKTVQTCITSPPYWGLRDYGTAKWVGGDLECDHKGEPMRTRAYININSGDGYSDVKNKENHQFYKSKCKKCGAVREDNQIGLEETPAQFVEKLVLVFREVRRVLKDDGTLWVNLGDSYNSNGGAGGVKHGYIADGRKNREKRLKHDFYPGLKLKDLVGIPWRVAFALQDDGWYLRQDIIWHKPNPMPESVLDRCTKAHEYIFLLSKSQRYYYDNNAIRTPLAPKTYTTFGTTRKPLGNDGLGLVKSDNYSRAVPNRKPRLDESGNIAGANKCSVWTVATRPYKEAHFATYPPQLIDPCILAGSKEGDTVLDPFSGAGTTGVVSQARGRDYIGIELNPEYAEMSRRRIKEAAPLFNCVEVVS